MNAMGKFWSDEQGATAVEYGLVVALIAVVMLVAVRALGTAISTKFDMIATQLDSASS